VNETNCLVVPKASRGLILSEEDHACIVKEVEAPLVLLPQRVEGATYVLLDDRLCSPAESSSESIQAWRTDRRALLDNLGDLGLHEQHSQLL
jgi:hypothetical protein